MSQRTTGLGTFSLRQIADFRMPRNRFSMSGPRVLPERTFLAFSAQHAAAPSQMPEEPVRASSDGDEFLNGLGRERPTRFFAPVIQHQRDRLLEVRQALFAGFSLAVCPGQFGAIRDKDRAIFFDDCGEFVVHESSLSRHARVGRALKGQQGDGLKARR